MLPTVLRVWNSCLYTTNPAPPHPPPPSPALCWQIVKYQRAIKSACVHPCRTYNGHECENVVLEVAAVMFHHFAVCNHHDFYKAGIGEEALWSPVRSWVTAVISRMLVFAHGEGIGEESSAQPFQISLHAIGRALLCLLSVSPVSLFVSWKIGS